MKGKFKIICVVCIFLITVFCLLYTRDSYAIDNINNYMGDYILNPEWVNYIELSDDEQDKYDVIPEMYIVSKIKYEDRKLFSFRNMSYPEYYNLNDLGYVTKPRNQYSLGLCWAFAGLASIESNLLINEISSINNPIIFSERQLDYAGVNKNYIIEGYNPYAIISRDTPGSGAYPKSAFQLFGVGVSPVTVNKFGYFNENKDVKSMKEVFNLDNVEYVVDSYVNLGSIWEYNSDTERDNWIKNIKNHVMNYGAVSISSIGPLAGFAGSCIYKDNNGNNMLNVNGECNPINENNRHAMAIIGWNDNYSYKYCRYKDETDNDLTNCENIVEGKGVFILKNSWGDTYPYPYLTYTSNVDSAYGVVEVNLKDWDMNYDYTKSYEAKYDFKTSIITYDRSREISENLVKIGIYSNSVASVNYQIYVDNDNSGNFNLIDEVNVSQIGKFSIDVDSIKLTEEKFSIKVISDNGYVDEITAFTKYNDDNKDIIIDTVIKTGMQYKSKIENFKLYSITRNVESGEKIDYRFVTEAGKDITDKITIKDNVVLNNMVKPQIVINEVLSSGKILVETLYNGQIFDTKEITVLDLISLWDSGNGTKEDPFIINSADDFVNIYADNDYLERHYKLGRDIDFSKVDNWNIGELSNYQSFRGSLDGNGYVIKGLSCNSNLCGLFYKLEDAIIKNIRFNDINYDVKEYGWGNLLGVLAYNSEFTNIIITKSVIVNGKGTYMGGIVGSGYNLRINNVANYANINSDYNYQNGRVSGIINEAYGCTINESYNYGNIYAKESIIGGIVAYLGNDGNNLGQIINSYNMGDIITNYVGGGIVGEGNLSLVNKTYSVIKNKSNYVGEIVGNAYGMVIKNSYYMNDNMGVYNNDKSTLTNVLRLTDSINNKDSYLEFDFDKVWIINGKYPYFRNFNYKFVQALVVDEEIIISNNNKTKLEIGFIPEDADNKNVKFLIGDTGIIEINGNLEIIPKNVGETKLKIITLDGNLVDKEITIKVIDRDIDISNYQVINNNYLKIPLNMNKDEFIDKILINKQYKVVVDSSDERDILATGDKIKIYSNLQVLVDEYQVVIMGDITGTGKINVNNVAKLYQYVRGKIEMDEEYRLAGNVVDDDKLAINDVAKLYQYIKEKINSLD